MCIYRYIYISAYARSQGAWTLILVDGSWRQGIPFYYIHIYMHIYTYIFSPLHNSCRQQLAPGYPHY